MNTSSNLLVHRVFTHSFLFVAIISVFFALIAERWHRPHNITFRKWLLFFGGVIFFHVFIDAFNNYGVGWLEPFTHKRISFNAIYVADAFFSVWPGIAVIVLIISKKKMVDNGPWT
jgi:inner membrane protein